MADILVLQLEEGEWDSGIRDNALMAHSTAEWIAVLNRDIKQDCIRRIQESNLLSHGEAVALCWGNSRDVLPDDVLAVGAFEDNVLTLEVKELLQMFMLSIIALIFPRKLADERGWYNGGLHASTDYELLCRLTEAKGTCHVVFTGAEGEKEPDWPVGRNQINDSTTFTWAYMVRRYLHLLHTYGIAEKVLTHMYEVARQSEMLSCMQENMRNMLNSDDIYESVALSTAPYVIFRGDDTCHGVLRDFADSLAGSLRDMGQAVILVEPGKTDYDYLGRQVCKGFIGFQSAAFGIPFFRKLKGVKIQFWLDNPVFYKKQFESMPPDCYVLCQDSNYAEFIRKHYHMERAVHFPPGGHTQRIEKWEERLYDIVFIGGYNAEDPTPLEAFEKAYYEHMLLHPWQTFTQGLEQTLDGCGMQMDIRDIEDMLLTMRQICQRIINHYRHKVIETILEAGYCIHVYGDSWDAYSSPHAEKLIRHSEVSVEESLDEWRKAKIGLNIMSWHKAGMTERIANIMLAGAVCLSDETVYLKENLNENEEIVLYRLDELEKLPKLIKKLLDDEVYRDYIARQGYEKACQEFTWDVRARQIAELCQKGK